MNFFKALLNEQNEQSDDEFIKTSELINVKENNKIYKIYLPKFVIKYLDKMDILKFNSYTFVCQQNETIEGFIQFLEDFLNNNTLLKFNNKNDFQKYLISQHFNPNFYIIESLDENNITILINAFDILKIYKDHNLFDNFIVCLLKNIKGEDKYVLKTIFDFIPDKCLNTKMLLHNNRIYNIKLLSKFDYLYLDTRHFSQKPEILLYCKIVLQNDEYVLKSKQSKYHKSSENIPDFDIDGNLYQKEVLW